MNRIAILEQLALVEGHIEQAERLLFEQQKIMQTAATREGHRLLALFESSLAMHLEHRDWLRLRLQAIPS